MRYLHVRPFAAIAAILLFSAPGKSQVNVLRGELQGLLRQKYVAELEDFQSHNKIGSADVEPDGSFELHNIPEGEYSLKITDYHGEVYYQEFVTCRAQAPALLIRMPEDAAAPRPGGPISVAQLLHPPARQALQAFAAAQKYSESGEFEKAAGELRKAIRISPDYAEAYNNLAVQNLRLGRFQEAWDELSHVIRIVPPTAMVLCNLAFTELKLDRRDDAIQSARWALRVDSHYAPARFLLGEVLALDRRTLPEGIANLEQAAKSMPAAQAELNRVRKTMSEAARF